MIGAGLLWTGWFGFNAGSALSASPLAALAFLNTSTAASTAVVVWAAIEWIHRGKPTALGGATAAVAGLVAITPGLRQRRRRSARSPSASASRSSATRAVTFLKPMFGYDDSLDVFGVHGARRHLGRARVGHLRDDARRRHRDQRRSRSWCS